MTPVQQVVWNKSIRDSVDALLHRGGYNEESSARHQLAMMNFDVAVEKAMEPIWQAERLDEYEIRVTSPEGESWRLRSADRNDSFNNFIWRWAESMVNKGEL